MQKILITGINGAIGSTIAEYLQDKFDIIGLSVESSCNYNIKINQYIQCDISKKEELEALPKDINAIIHCAALITHDNFSDSLLKVNCIGCQNIANYAQKTDFNHLIYFSSLPIIGKPTLIPIPESHPIDPPTVYHLSKYFGELLFKILIEKSKLTIFRIPSPIGRKTPKTKIVPSFIDKSLNNENIILLGKGLRIQNYIDIRDIARAVELSLLSSKRGIFNLSADNSYSNLDLANKCIKLFNSKSEILYQGTDNEEDFKWIISNDKIKKELGFYQQYSIEDSLKEISKNFKV